MNEEIGVALLIVGAAFVLLAAFGIFRMPDLFMRMQTASKGSTLGLACLVLGVAVHFGQLGITTRAILVIIFFFLTGPVAAHMIARAAYFIGVPLWEGTVIDEARGSYDEATHVLASRRPRAGLASREPDET